jgi:hypothetical protein
LLPKLDRIAVYQLLRAALSLGLVVRDDINPVSDAALLVDDIGVIAAHLILAAASRGN